MKLETVDKAVVPSKYNASRFDDVLKELKTLASGKAIKITGTEVDGPMKKFQSGLRSAISNRGNGIGTVHTRLVKDDLYLWKE